MGPAGDSDGHIGLPWWGFHLSWADAAENCRKSLDKPQKNGKMWIIERAERKAYMEPAPRREPQPLLTLPPLRVSGLVVSRADLVAVLRAFISNLAPMRPLDGREDFVLELPLAQAEGVKGP